jgi:CcmD family protein
MRVASAVCVLLSVFACVPGVFAAQPTRGLASVQNPALPPAPPPPLYFAFRSPGEASQKSLQRDFEEGNKRPDAGLRLLAQQRPDEGFKPISELPPTEQLPAGPMLVAAYVFVVLALFAYLLSLSRRLNAVSREIVRLDAQLKQR